MWLVGRHKTDIYSGALYCSPLDILLCRFTGSANHPYENFDGPAVVV